LQKVQEVVVKGIYNSAAKSVKKPICGFSIMCRRLLVMKHFAVYHNSERMGYLADEVSELCIVTNKSVVNLIGNRIWLFQGEGKPRKYILRGTFIADFTRADTDNGFRHVVSGQQGTLFKPHIPVGTLAWFERFKKSQGNFAFGLQRITDQIIVDELKRISGIV
jgi:hypothetical protein